MREFLINKRLNKDWLDCHIKSDNIKDLIVGFRYVGESTIFILKEDLTSDIEKKILDFSSEEIENYEPKIKSVEDLRIWEVLQKLKFEYLSLGMLMSLDFTLIGLSQIDWTIKKGKRENRLYYDSNNMLTVEHIYNYEFSQEGNVKNYTQTINWYNKKGEVGLTKEVNIQKGSGSIIRLNRIIRQNQIDYLIEEGENLRSFVQTLTLDTFGGNELLLNSTREAYIDIANSLDYLIKYFDTDIRLYVLRGIKDFENKVNSIVNGDIADEVVLEKLLKPVENAPSEEYPNVKRVYQSILEQIS